MALSNIFREPRREITETVVGVLAVTPLMWTAYAFANWFVTAVENPPPYVIALVMGAVVSLVALMVVWVTLYLTHVVGEVTCGLLENAGLRLRPRRRR